MTHSLTDHRRIEPNRILGLAAAITINTALVMMLLIPIHAPPMPPMPTVRQVIQWVTPTPIVKPEVVPVTKPTTP
ncbi:MAG: hypothetical protein JWL98_2216, partial [Xanthomonadaceae bacterium]|nr:hypothetical protein [Xanthomonadaceae bacterium]